MSQIKYSLIVPVFNEEQVMAESYRRLTEVLSSLDDVYEIIFIDDGSRDNSGKILKELAEKDSHVQIISFARNFGHQLAISAGFASARGEAIIVIDADLQDPPEVIPEMIKCWKEGFDVVYGKRTKREGETLFKKWTSKAYYRFLSRMTDVSIPVDVGDFRLIDRKVCDALNSMKEKNRYIRGLISWLGFKQTDVQYVREPRFAGKTKYSLNKMLQLAANGIISFSSKPLRLAIAPGILLSVAGMAYMIYVLYLKIFTEATELGWASLMCIILLLNGYTLIILGIMGEYLGRLFDESKSRPLYVIQETVFQDPK